MKRASLLTLTLIGAFSAIQAAWAVDYPLPPTAEADWLGKIKRIRCKKGIKTFRLLPDVLILRQC